MEIIYTIKDELLESVARQVYQPSPEDGPKEWALAILTTKVNPVLDPLVGNAVATKVYQDPEVIAKQAELDALVKEKAGELNPKLDQAADAGAIDVKP